MGMPKGSNVLHSVTGISRADVGAICRGIALAYNLDTPKMVADCSNIVYKFGSKSNSQTRLVANHLMKWANSGIEMEPVCDNEIRPACKQASNQRIAKKEKLRIKAFTLRKEVREMKKRLREVSLTETERHTLIMQVKSKEKACKSSESQSRSSIPNNFCK